MNKSNRIKRLLTDIILVVRSRWLFPALTVAALCLNVGWVWSARADVTSAAEVTTALEEDVDSTPDNRDVEPFEDDTAYATIHPLGFMVQKSLVGVVWDESSETHIFDFHLRGRNNGTARLYDLSLIENFRDGLGFLGTDYVFQGVVDTGGKAPAVVYQPADGFTQITIDPTFDGDLQLDVLSPASSRLEAGAEFVVGFSIRVDTDASYLASTFQNQVRGEANGDNENSGFGTIPLVDLSDNADFIASSSGVTNTDNAPGDVPTPLPALRLDKSLRSVTYPLNPGQTENDIAMVFEFTLQNVGELDLFNLELVDDLLDQTMVEEILSVSITNGPPGGTVWNAYDIAQDFIGFTDPSSAQLTPFQNSGGVTVATLEPDDSVVVFIEVEARLNPTENETFLNTAAAQGYVDLDNDGSPETGTTSVYDDSDGDGDLDLDDPDDPGDDGGDDPVKLPLIATTKLASADGAVNIGGNQYEVTYEHAIYNLGSVDLVDLTFVDAFCDLNADILTLDSVSIDAFALNGVPAATSTGAFTAFELLPAYITGPSGPGVTCPPTPGNEATETPFTSGDAVLEPGDVLTFEATLQFTMASGLQTFILENIATASGYGDADGDGLPDETTGDMIPDTKVSDDSGATIDENETTVVGLAAMQVEKELVDVQPSDRVDGDTTLMTFEIRLNNLGPKPLVDVQLTEDLEGLLGGVYAAGGLVGIETMPAQIGAPNDPAVTVLTFNPNFDGTTANSAILTTESAIAGQDTARLTFTVEVDHDSPLLPNPLINTTTATAYPDNDEDGDADAGAGLLSDTSDDRFDNDADSTQAPTPLPSLKTSKTVSVPFATVGTSGETTTFAGQFEFAITNTSELPIYRLSMRDDFVDDPYVREVLSATISDMTSTFGSFDGSAIDSAFVVGVAAGGAAPSTQPFLDSLSNATPVLQAGETLTFKADLTIDLEPLTPDSVDILNSALTIGYVDLDGDGSIANDGGARIEDLSDVDDALAQDGSDAGPDLGDDPTPLLLARLSAAHYFEINAQTGTIGTQSTIDPNYVEFFGRVVVQNTGDVPLTNVMLVAEDPVTWGTTVLVDQPPTIAVAPNQGSPFTPGTAYDPALNNFNLAGTGSLLRVGEKTDIRFQFRVDLTDPNIDLPWFETDQIVVSGLVAEQPTGPFAPQPLVFGPNLEPIMVYDLSDSGTDPLSSNAGAPGDTGGTDDPTPLSAHTGVEFRVLKSARPTALVAGDFVNWEVRVLNTGTIAGVNVDIVDILPPGFAYVRNTAELDGVLAEPTIALPGDYPKPTAAPAIDIDGAELFGEGEVLVWRVPSFPVGEEFVFTLLTQASIAVDPGQTFINRAYVYDESQPDADRIRSNIAEAEVTIIADPVFDCATVIGQVFRDRNKNGYQDSGEEGLAGARMATLARGTALTITGDAYGRYHIPCAAIPNADRGSNIIVKLDTRTLPAGYKMTTENPRVVRLTPGKAVKMNFGAAPDRLVELDLNRCAFVRGSLQLTQPSQQGLPTLIKALKAQQSTLRISYRYDRRDAGLAEQRMRLLQSLLRRLWASAGGNYDLDIETETIRLVGAPLECVPTSGELLGLGRVDGLPAGSIQVRGESLARFRVEPGYSLYLSPEGTFYLVEDSTALGSAGLDLNLGELPAGSRIVDPASVGVSIVPRGFAVVQTPNGRVLLSPLTPEAARSVQSLTNGLN